MLEKLQSTLNALNTQRTDVANTGWVLQNCWLVQVKPGGTARTDSKYWQVRSRSPMFDGKTLKHLKLGEVEDYRAAIERGRMLKQIDGQIEKLQQQIAQLTSIDNSSSCSLENSLPLYQSTPLVPTLMVDALQPPMQNESFKRSLDLAEFTDLAEQECLVREVLANSRALRASLRQAIARGKQLGARSIDLKQGYSPME